MSPSRNVVLVVGTGLALLLALSRVWRGPSHGLIHHAGALCLVRARPEWAGRQ